MANVSTARTIRRCTAILAILLSTLLIFFQGYLGYRGVDVHFEEVWLIGTYVSYGMFFGSLAYLVGSIGISVSGDGSPDVSETG